LGIESEEYLAVRLEMFLEVVQKKIPFLCSPRNFFDAIEPSRKSRDPIEFPAEFGERLERFDLPSPAFDLKEIEQLSKDRVPFQIETQTAMTELLADVQKKA